MPPESLYDRAQQVIPGGVNSPVRAFGAVGGEPIYVVSGDGARVRTADGRALIDFCCSWGPLILGHARAEVVEAVRSAAARGTSFGINTPTEVEFAELLCELVPALDKVRVVNSGTEAVTTALRLARGYTGRRRLLKFAGCYHGHVDPMLVSAGSGLLTGGKTSSAGVPDEVAGDTFVAPYNDAEAVWRIIDSHGADLAAIIVEPVAGNMGLVAPREDFLPTLRAAADDCGALLILDEVITGFRFAPTTYGALHDIPADIVCLGKIIGGGMPIGAVGGRQQIMEKLAPQGPVYQAGTLSGNPVALAAGLATLRLLVEEDPYPRLEELGQRLGDGLNRAAELHGVPMRCAVLGGVFTPFFRIEPVHELSDARTCDTTAFAAFFHAMLDAGVYLSPSQFEVGFISAAHTADDVDAFVSAADSAFGDWPVLLDDQRC